MKPREPKSFENAILIVAAELTPEGAGEVLGVTAWRIRAAMDPDRDQSSPLNIKQAAMLDNAYNEKTSKGYPILEAYKSALTTCAEGPKEAPITLMSYAIKEMAEASQAFAQAFDEEGKGGQRVLLEEYRSAMKEIQEAREALNAMEAKLSAAHQKDSIRGAA